MIRKKMLVFISILTIILLQIASPVNASDNESPDLMSAYILSAGETKNIEFVIENNDSAEHSYTVKLEGGTNNYESYFTAGLETISTVTIPAKESMQITLNLTLTGEQSNDTDILQVNTLRDDGKQDTIYISVIVNTDYMLTISSMTKTAEAVNGDTIELNFLVYNSGSKELNSIKLEPDLPYKWIVTSGDSIISNLKPGDTVELKLILDVPSTQTAGNFTIKCSAASDETISEAISVPVTIRAKYKVAYFLIGALLLAAVFTIYQFSKHGRR